MKKYSALILVFVVIQSSNLLAQATTGKSSLALQDLGFQAKLMHLTFNPTPVVKEEPVKKSTRSVADILASKKVKNKSFHLIAGCFANEDNAINLHESLKKQGYNSSMYQEKDRGLYFVAFESFHEKEQALQTMTSLNNKGVQTWMSTY
jgi:cell division protein FtsN